MELNERKFDLGSGTMGNGVSIWNRAKEVHGDYEKIAHIDQNRKITYHIKNPPKEVKDYVEKIAKGKNFASTVSQPHMKVFKEMSEDRMKLIDKYLTEDYTQKELDKIDYNAPTVNVQVRDYDGNKTKWLGLNDKQSVGEFMKFLRNRANAF